MASAWASAAVAESAAGSAEADPPGVARVSLIEGEASYHRRDGDDWTGVAVNAPLVTGDRFYAGESSRAEIQLAPATYVRLDAATEIDLVELAADVTQVRVPVGRATLRLREDPGSRHVELDTPTVALVLRGPGAYRVDVDVGGRTTVRLDGGEAVAHVGSQTYDLSGDASAVIDDVGGGLGYRTVAYAPADGFDEWEAGREARIATAVSYQHVDDAIYGAEDLDQYGTWEYESDYGYLWRPTAVSADWAPYTDGRWSWVSPWGWTWIDYAPWGWAPFHYGRWLYRNSYWYWAPGPIGVPPVYAPALVGFYGWGGGFGFGASVSFGFGFGGGYGGYVGWVPLGWGEPCFPWWGGWGGARIGYPWWGGWGGPWVVNNNVIINKNITNINVDDVRYSNRYNPGAFSTVPREDFGRGGRPIAVRGADGDGFEPVGGRLDITPDRDGFQTTDPARASIGRGARPPESGERSSITRTAGARGADRGLDGSGEGGRRSIGSTDAGERSARASRFGDRGDDGGAGLEPDGRSSGRDSGGDEGGRRGFAAAESDGASGRARRDLAGSSGDEPAGSSARRSLAAAESDGASGRARRDLAGSSADDAAGSSARRSLAAASRDDAGSPAGRRGLASSSGAGARSSSGRRALASSGGSSDPSTASRRGLASSSGRRGSDVPRPPSTVQSRRTVSAPRSAATSRGTPYVAERPTTTSRSAWSSAGRPNSAARATGSARSSFGRSADAGRTGSGFTRPPTWSRSESVGAGSRSGVVRSPASPRGSFSQVGRLDGGAASRGRSAGGRSSAYSGSTAREPRVSAPRTASRAPASGGSRAGPSGYGRAPTTSRAPYGGGRQAQAPQASQAPRYYGGGRQAYRAPQTSQAPRSYGDGRQAYAAPPTSQAPRSYGGSRQSYSAPPTSQAPRSYGGSQPGYSGGGSSGGTRSWGGGSSAFGSRSGGGFSGSRGFGSGGGSAGGRGFGGSSGFGSMGRSGFSGGGGRAGFGR